jgi:hypothetical protein
MGLIIALYNRSLFEIDSLELRPIIQWILERVISSCKSMIKEVYLHGYNVLSFEGYSTPWTSTLALSSLPKQGTSVKQTARRVGFLLGLFDPEDGGNM